MVSTSPVSLARSVSEHDMTPRPWDSTKPNAVPPSLSDTSTVIGNGQGIQPGTGASSSPHVVVCPTCQHLTLHTHPESGRPGVHHREATILGTDPTCLPPITAGRKRTLVLCFDGTGDSFDMDISNVATIFSMLKKDDKTLQMCYYQAGIGTYLAHHTSIPGMKTFEKTVDQAVAWYLSSHVKEGYEFLMQNYAAGDNICLFGFSRGAYTARALAGMLHKVGLLPKDNKQQVAFAWRMYKDSSEAGWKLSRQFKQSFCSSPEISLIGVFDTVSSVGLFGRSLPFTTSNHEIRHFRHAMALDERRAMFRVNHWGVLPNPKSKSNPGMEERDGDGEGKMKMKSVRKGHEVEWEEKMGTVTETDVKEVWFAGGHADVGGGNVKNGTTNALSRIPLRWMVRETFKCNTGILWDIDGLKKIGLDPDLLYPEVVVPNAPSASAPAPAPATVVESPFSSALPSPAEEKMSSLLERDELSYSYPHKLSVSPSLPPQEEVLNFEDHPDRQDAICPMYDYLGLKKAWWILEVLPSKAKKQVGAGKWKSIYSVNMGKGRIAPHKKAEDGPGMLIHRSVQIRQNEMKEYKWRATSKHDPTWTE